MIFSFDLVRARKGDCFLLHFGEKASPGLVIVDGGPKSVYAPHLKPRLEAIRKARGLDAQDQLLVDVLMVSHVDDDHIQGLLDLAKEELLRKDRHAPQMLNVQTLWHNSFDDLIGETPDELKGAVEAQFGTASLAGDGELADEALVEVEAAFEEENPGGEHEILHSGLMVLASVEQGHRLRVDAKKLGWAPNDHHGGKLIVARKGAKPAKIGDDLRFAVAGPMQPEIAALQKKHQDWLKELKAKGKKPPQALAAYVDQSVPNLSSIVVLAECGPKRMLLTGDARGDKILAGLELIGALGPNGRIHVDLLKVPHHGSGRNLEQGFFERVTADHYVFSGDGEHGNPERQAFEMLLAARKDAPFTIHLTYPVEEIEEGRKADWLKEQAKEKKRKAKTGKGEVRPDWSDAEEGLKPILDRLKPGQTIRFSPETGGHVIDLLDPLGF